MKKKYAVAFLATFFLIFAIPIITLVLAQPATATPIADSLGVGDASGDKGTYAVVPVNITNATNGPVLGIGFDIAYNKNVINATDVLKGNLVPSNWADPNVNNNFIWGTKITIAGFYAADAIPNGTSGSVVLLNFSVIGLPGDTSPMNMTLIELSNPDGEVGRTAPARNGTFTVTQSGETTPTPAPTSSTGGGGGGGYVPTTPTPKPTEKPPAIEEVAATPSPTLAPTVTSPTATPAQTPAPTIPVAQVPVMRWFMILMAIFISVIIVLTGYLLIRKMS
jgi:hypothetical protein